MAVSGTASIYRIDTSGQTEINAEGFSPSQTIEFNTGATTPDALSFLESYFVHWVEDVSQHKNPKKALDKLQDGLLGTRELVLSGWFENPDTSAGLVKLADWMGDPKTNASLPFGRFGVRVDDISNLDIVPSATVGWLLHDVVLDIPPDHPYECNFTIKLWLNGTHP